MGGRGVTRRGIVAGAAAGAAGAALPSAAAAKRVRRKKTDVVVVGAGLAGLTAARELVRAGVKSVVLVEARKRVGGRTFTRTVSGVPVDVGGQWWGPTQNRIKALADELGVKAFPTYNTGDNVYFRSGSTSRYASSGPLGPIPPDATGAPEAFKAIQQLNDMAKSVPPDRPWAAPSAREWDGQTFETWKLANTTTDGGRFLLDLGIEAVWAAEPRDVSLLHVLFYIASAGSFDALINTANGAQEGRFVGGAQQLSIRMAEELGRRVILGSPVRRIAQPKGGVRVESDRIIATARRVIVAVAPALTAHIDFRPGLPALRDQLTQRFPMGSVIKCQAVYARPFWRDDGLTGQATSDTGPCRITFDNTPPEGAPGVMLGFIEGDESREWGTRPAAERKKAVLESFARYYGEAALSPSDYVEMNWSEERWTRGCYTGFTPPGVLTAYGEALRAPVGRVHWASTETATQWSGYMDGAVQSGQRAAKEVLEAL